MRPKYKISINDLEQRHNVAKLERDGYNRESIIKEMYRQTDGMNQVDRTKLVEKLFDRSER